MTNIMDKKRRKIFIVKHKKTNRQQNEFERLSVSLRHLPEDFSNFTITCSQCKTVIRPDWFKKHELSMISVKPKFEKKGIDYLGPKRWILQQIMEKCSNCNSDILIKLPVNKMRTKGNLFGDDADRNYQNNKVFIYSLVGVDHNLLPEFDNKINNVKLKLFPSISPYNWKIHMKDMWAGSSRRKDPIYKNLEFCDIKNFIDELLILIRESNLFIYNIATTIKHNNTVDRKSQKQRRNEIYILLILNAIDEWTSKNAQPNIFFDSEKKSLANETIHGWAKDIFKGNQYSLLYRFLSKGIEIPEPKFIVPASAPGLEIADFISFTIARYYLRMWQGKEIEINPKDLGLVTYLGYDSNGDLLWRRQEGYPWDQFIIKYHITASINTDKGAVFRISLVQWLC